jgi:hypothetical protein
MRTQFCPSQFILDPNGPLDEVVQERDSSGAIVASYSYGMDRLLGILDSTARFYLPDRLGSVRQITDSVGAVLDTRHYDAFGSAQ